MNFRSCLLVGLTLSLYGCWGDKVQPHRRPLSGMPSSQEVNHKVADDLNATDAKAIADLKTAISEGTLDMSGSKIDFKTGADAAKYVLEHLKTFQDLIDHNKDGLIQLDEVKAAIHLMQVAIRLETLPPNLKSILSNPEALAAALKNLGEKELTREFSADWAVDHGFGEQESVWIAEAFKKFDFDGDGALSLLESATLAHFAYESLKKLAAQNP